MGLRILYVEDEPDIRAIAKMTMKSLGKFDVREAPTGMDALVLAADYIPDLVILDVMMPGMTGPETFVKLRELPAFKDIPIIFMTAKVQAHEVAGYMALGALGVINKPFDPMQLCGQINALWEKHRSTALSA